MRIYKLKAEGSPVKFASLHIFDIFNGAGKAQRGPQITQITQINKKNKGMKTGCTSTNVFGWLTLR